MFSRRKFLKASLSTTSTVLISSNLKAENLLENQKTNWRAFESNIQISVLNPCGVVQAWIPLPSMNEGAWIKNLNDQWFSSDPRALISLHIDEKYKTKLLHVLWPNGTKDYSIKVTSRISTCDRSVLSSERAQKAFISDWERELYTAATELIPTDSIVKKTSDKITEKAVTDFDKARAIYDWVIDNSFRNPKTRGCGLGDILYMLKSEDLSGKCADINALYVGLARASGLPARDVYGLRIGPSMSGYNCLGAKNNILTKSQHCRAEVFLEKFGWTPVDPADVRKVVLEEPPGNLSISDPKVLAAREILFGTWEGNWMAYNVGHDIVLPNASGPKLPFLMYPQVECNDQRLDPLNPELVTYSISGQEIKPT